MRLDAVARLEHVAITTFGVVPGALDGVLPEGVELNGEPLVSAVSFRVCGFRFERLPRPRLTCGHVDYRTYVRHRGETAVWFLGAHMDSRLASVPRLLWGMPWRRAPMTIESGAQTYTLHGAADLEVVSDGSEPGAGLHADDLAKLVNPGVGLYARRGRVARYEVSHEPLAPVLGRATVARFPALDGIAGPLHSVVLVPPFGITIHLPPVDS